MQITDIDVSYALLFIMCKIFYVVDITMLSFLFVRYLYLILKLKHMRHLYDKKRLP